MSYDYETIEALGAKLRSTMIAPVALPNHFRILLHYIELKDVGFWPAVHRTCS